MAAARDLRARGFAEVVVVSLGEAGALLVADATALHLPAIPVRVESTVGAGDSFMAGLISGLLDADYLGGAEAREALRHARLVDVMPAIDRAISTSATTVSKAGAYAPTRDEL